MSEKHLFKFQQENDYRIAKRNHLILPNISTVVESGNTYINSALVSKVTAETGDIVVYHESANGMEIGFMKPEAFDSDNGYWSADSIVVVPFKHTNDGTVRVMNLDYANNGEPVSVGDNVENADMKHYGGFIAFSSVQEQTIEGTHSLNVSGNFASDSFDSVANPFDVETGYSASGVAFVSSPFNNDGSKNEAYHSIGAFSEFTQNPLQDMDGRGNTEAIISYVNGLDNAAGKCVEMASELKPSNVTTVDGHLNIDNAPWYLPSAGEMGYFMARKARIDYALTKIGKTLLTSDAKFVTSTLSADSAKVLAFNIEGNVGYFDFTQNDFFAVPFCKL